MVRKGLILAKEEKHSEAEAPRRLVREEPRKSGAAAGALDAPKKKQKFSTVLAGLTVHKMIDLYT